MECNLLELTRSDSYFAHVGEILDFQAQILESEGDELECSVPACEAIFYSIAD